MGTSDTLFRRIGAAPLLEPSALNWPMKESAQTSIMFPTVLRAPDWLQGPVDSYYMYYASHTGNGIGLATAPTPQGPWTPFAKNPVLHLDDVAGFRGHISSPEIVPLEQSGRLRMYFHGPRLGEVGQGTGVAESRDGLRFAQVPGTECILPPRPDTWQSRMSAYMRTFRRGSYLYGILMGHDGSGIRGCTRNHQGLFRSQDGVTWEAWPSNPLLGPDEAHGEHGTIRHVGLWLRGDILWIAYSTRDANLEVERLCLARMQVPGEDWSSWGEPERLGTLLTPELEWEGSDLRDPFLFPDGDCVYMYYAGGLEAGIGLAVAEAAAFDALRV